MELLPFDVLQLRSSNPPESEQAEFVNLVRSGMTIEQAALKVKPLNLPPIGVEKYH